MSVSDVVGKGIGELGLRFFLVGMIPSAILILFLATLFWSGALAGPPDITSLRNSISELDARDGILLIAAILLLSLVLEPFQLFIIRLFEGYWGKSRIGKMITNAGRQIQSGRYRRLQNTVIELGSTEEKITEQEKDARIAEVGAIKTELDQCYPKDEDRFLPTRLGNVLRAAEDTAGSRYGFDTIVIWPRLYPLISEKLHAVLDDQRNQLDLTVRMSMIFILCTISSLVFLYNDGWWLSLPAATFVLAWLSYQSSINVAKLYGKSMNVAFDLYRFELLKTLHLPLPCNRDAELQTNEKLTAFFALGTGPSWQYKHD